VSDWAVEMLVATALLMVLVLLLRRSVARLFGARAAFALWLAPGLRFVLPPIAPVIEAPAGWSEAGAAVATAIAMTPIESALASGKILLWLWLGGAALFLAFHVIVYRRFLTAALVGATPVTQSGVDDAAILSSDAVTGPAASGLLVRRIFVPRDFVDAFSTEERRLAIAHEVLHHRRFDLWASAAALIALALHWFNPLAYAAHRAFRRDLELACDAHLLSRADPATRQAYARTILRCVARPVPLPICALTNNKDLKGRIAMMNAQHGLFRRLSGTACAAVLALGGLTLALPASAQDAVAEQQKKTVKVIRLGLPADVDLSKVRMVGCPNKLTETKVEAGNGPRTKFLLCAKPGATKAQNADLLERSLVRIEGEPELPAATKAQIVTALKAQIAELRSGN